MVGFDLEWNKFFVSLNGFVRIISTDDALDVENGIFRIYGCLVLGSVTNKSLSIFCESNIRGGDVVSLVICNDFDLTVLEDANTRVSGTQIDSDNWPTTNILGCLFRSCY